MPENESTRDHITRILGGVILGAIVTVVITLLGFPDIYILWGVAAAILFWFYFEPTDPEPIPTDEEAET